LATLDARAQALTGKSPSLGMSAKSPTKLQDGQLVETRDDRIPKKLVPGPPMRERAARPVTLTAFSSVARLFLNGEYAPRFCVVLQTGEVRCHVSPN
jgi:hypothetical protein